MDEKNILVFSPHADDATIFVGGTLAKLAAEGRKIYIARVTNDDFDSFGLDVESTIIKNHDEAESAYRTLGASEVIHMGYKSDYMMGADYNQFRGEVVELIRKIRPYTIFTFDTEMKAETNMDHKVIAAAVAETLWISSFDLHYPEHFKKGYLPFSVPESINFSTAPDEDYTVNDISSAIDIKCEALCCHKTPVNNMLQTKLFGIKCAELPTDDFEEIIGADRNYVIDMFARKLAMDIGKPFGVEYGEMISIHPPGLGIFGD